MTEPNQPAAPPPPPYGAPPPYGYGYGYGYGPPPGQRVNDPAPMGMRLLARIIDALITGVITIVIDVALGFDLFQTSSDSGTTTASLNIFGANYFKYVVIGIVVSGLYEVPMLVGKGATLGKMAVGVRVARMADGAKPDLPAAVTRWVIPAVSGVFFLLQYIVYLSPFFDSTHRNRGWYDYAAKTIAVRTR